LFAHLENEEVEESKILIKTLSEKMGRIDEIPDLVEARAILEEIQKDSQS
jgi:hypothetical protein